MRCDRRKRSPKVRPHTRAKSLEWLERRCLLAGDVLISEFMAANASGLADEDRDFSDWIELENQTSSAIDLTGWTISDDIDEFNKWTFPQIELPANGRVIVFASGKNRREIDSELHANFKLSRDGEYLGLGRPDGTIEDEFRDTYPAQRSDVSFGQTIIEGKLIRGFMTDPTPGEQNAISYFGFVDNVRIDVPGGFFDEPLVVRIASDVSDATIRYTLDGSKPTESNGLVYTEPLQVSSTTTLRATAFKSGFVPSDTETSSYLFLNEIVGQTRPESYPELTTGDNYEVDPDIAQSPQYYDRFLAGLRDIPTLSLVMDKDDFLGRTGIYSNPLQRGYLWERAASVEWIDPKTNATTQVDAGIRVQGGASRNPAIGKHSLSLRFRDEYGADQWEYDLFENTPVSQFTTLALRAGSNNSWVSGNAVDRLHAQSIRDQWIRDSVRAMGHVDAGAGRFVHIYINGLYWGVYNLTERPDAEHYAAYFGGAPSSYDAFNGSELIDGTANARREAVEIAEAGNWETLQEVVDIDRYIDYNIINRYGANGDLDVTRNYRLAGGGPDRAPFRIYPWDSEEVLINGGSTGIPTDPLGLRLYVEKLEEYRVRFGDRLQKHFFNDGALTANRSAERWMERADEL
ncbi:MAG: chitobiase/beta-hexosaminidase C-terminal domain-containing protein, partial [Planctomycetales bacterium]|nr:chitobiase/beta-hexosaminidase C-terminal domain-containing protein [Planctomycetales bacterium]